MINILFLIYKRSMKRNLNSSPSQNGILEKKNIEYDYYGREIKKIKKNIPIHKCLMQRETGFKTKFKTSILPLPLKNGSLELKRYFLNGKTIDELLNELNTQNKKIYNIFSDFDYEGKNPQNILRYTKFNKFSQNYDNYHGQREQQYSSLQDDNFQIVEFDITAKKKFKLSDDIDFIHFLFIDTDYNFYYIDYFCNSDVFELFKSLYGGTLKLNVYPDIILQSIADTNDFKHKYETNVINKTLYTNFISTQGGCYYRKNFKKILKKY